MSENFVGTMPVRSQHAFDERALADWIGVHVAGESRGPLEIVQFKGGQSNPTYLVSSARARYVMRSKPAPAAKLLPSAHAIEREFQVMQALHSAAIPVPRMVALCEDESVLGRAFFLMEYVDGRILWDPALPGMSASERGAVYDEMNRVIAALHSVDYAAIGLAEYGRPGSYLERQVSRWTRQYQASKTEELLPMEKLIEWLPANIPSAEDRSVVHGDYRLDNLVFHRTEPKILAILDWELSTLGHPLADFAYHCLAWHIPAGEFRGMAGLDFAQLGIPAEPDYVARYCSRRGRAAIDHWDFYLAYNLFRLAAILQGVMKRHLEGVASSEHAADAGRRAGALAALGWQIAQNLKG
jgi:aminoglycoside phosphotransferase (APT) family kinase protein